MAFKIEAEHVKAKTTPVNVMVVVPDITPAAAIPTTGSSVMPRFTALDNSEEYEKECIALKDWNVGAGHDISWISGFMSDLGGCTVNGKIFWRLEDKQVVSILDDGWFQESRPGNINVRANMKSILMGSPGIGKSTILCVVAFYLAFKHKKNVLVYRKLFKMNQENCLFYLGYENGELVTFRVRRCKTPNAIDIYEELIRQQDISNVWLLLDGFRYDEIPEGVRTFRTLATSQQVDLKSQESVDAYCCLLPCWSMKDLQLMGRLLFDINDDDAKERFYYSGGSVREFTRPTPDDILDGICSAVALVEDVPQMFLSPSSVSSGRSQVDRLRRTFVQDISVKKHFVSRQNWQQVIDSEYAVLSLSLRLRSDALSKIYHWARAAGYESLAGNVFELYIHRLAAERRLTLFMSEYDPKEGNEPRHLKVERVALKRGNAICNGTAKDHASYLKGWKDDKEYSYWFPSCHNFPNIDSIVKLESGNVEYLQITVAKVDDIDAKKLVSMNKIFSLRDVGHAGDIEPPIYLAVCPDLKTCQALVLKPDNEALEARKVCKVFVGYYEEAAFAIGADGPVNYVPVKDLPPPPPYNLRKRQRTE